MTMPTDADRIIAELRRQNRLQIYYAVGALACIPLLILGMVGVSNLFQTFGPHEPTWCMVEGEASQGRYTEALEHAKVLVEKHPDDYERHVQIGKIYLLNGDLTGAEQHFRRAAEILPIPENKQLYDAIIERKGRSQPPPAN